jgi:hypothetical protein
VVEIDGDCRRLKRFRGEWRIERERERESAVGKKTVAEWGEREEPRSRLGKKKGRVFFFLFWPAAGRTTRSRFLYRDRGLYMFGTLCPRPAIAVFMPRSRFCFLRKLLQSTRGRGFYAAIAVLRQIELRSCKLVRATKQKQRKNKNNNYLPRVASRAALLYGH